ncbi:MAG: Nif3-like dinuclear metal center hexameric protein [Actinobacteria bacterium]|nr:Nif3-like dinuclear metal center hexameric protein [Actinomycetota bacterium]
MPLLGDLIEVLESWFDPRWAESWDAVGLVCGDSMEPVRRVLLAVDPVPATVGEAIAAPAQLLLTHHPLLLTPVHGVPADDPKGGLIHRLVRAGCALFVAHTNADVADSGVSDALARRIGLDHLRPLQPLTAPPLDKLVVFVPSTEAGRLIDSLAAAGAGRLGDYERCAWSSEGLGTFVPGAAARPAIGRTGEIETVVETRVEMVVPRGVRTAVLTAMRAAHPYEQVAYDLYPTIAPEIGVGLGRVGQLSTAQPLAEFVDRVAQSLPATAWGVRAAGDPQALIGTVAVCGGSGGSLAELARDAGADALVTADLKHHATLEASVERTGLALVDAGHWSTEAPWLDDVARRLRDHFGAELEVAVSRQPTDPWNVHAPPRRSGAPTE